MEDVQINKQLLKCQLICLFANINESYISCVSVGMVLLKENRLHFFCPGDVLYQDLALIYWGNFTGYGLLDVFMLEFPPTLFEFFKLSFFAALPIELFLLNLDTDEGSVPLLQKIMVKFLSTELIKILVLYFQNDILKVSLEESILTCGK